MAGTEKVGFASEKSPDLVTKAIGQRMAEIIECYNQKNFKGCGERYTEDCKFIAAGKPVIRGREEYICQCEAMYNEGVTSLSLHDEEYLSPCGEMAAENGTYKLFDKDDKVIDHGKFVSVWKRIEGQWYIHFNIFNSDVSRNEPSPLDVVNERLKEFGRCWNSGDFKALGNLYTPDCKLFPSGQPVCVGIEDTAKLLKDEYESGSVRIEAVSIEAHKMGDDLIASLGSWTFYDKNGVRRDHGNDVLVWKRLDDGKWYRHFDAFNSEINP